MQNLNQGVPLNRSFGVAPSAEHYLTVAEVGELTTLGHQLGTITPDTFTKRLLGAFLAETLKQTEVPKVTGVA